VRALRAVLVVTAVVTVVTAVAFLAITPVDAAAVGLAVWTLVPGTIALVLSRRLRHARPRTFWAVLGLEAFYVLLALSRVAAGEPQGLTNLVLPVAALVLLTRAPARRYLLGR
jgi:hypothetical protein